MAAGTIHRLLLPLLLAVFQLFGSELDRVLLLIQVLETFLEPLAFSFRRVAFVRDLAQLFMVALTDLDALNLLPG